jgi:hypothetical protein
MRGRVEQGKAGSGLCYGYRAVRQTDARGEPIRGEREIVEEQAAIVRRIFQAFTGGKSPRMIAAELNREGIPGPMGSPWSDGAIRGHATRGTGLLNNELYTGTLVWNRQRFIKDPATGKRVSRLNPETEWIRTPVPDQRIIDDELWQAAKAQQRRLATRHAGVIAAMGKARQTKQDNALSSLHRPRSLLSGLVFCGVCDGPYALRGQDRLACTRHVTTNTCTNSRSIKREELESRVLDGLRERLMAPEAAAAAIRAYAEELNQLNRARRLSLDSDRKALAQLQRQMKEIVTTIENGGGSRMLVERLRDLEGQEDDLTRRLAETPADVPDLNPNLAKAYRRKISTLSAALNQPHDRQEAIGALRALITRITLTPGPRRGQIDATLHGDLAASLALVSPRQQKNRHSRGNVGFVGCGGQQ